MRFLLSLLATVTLGAAVLTACSSTASQQQANGRQSSNTNVTVTPANRVAASDSHAADDGHGHAEDGAARINIEDAKKAFDSGNAIFVDTRAAASYEGKHIKGALNIPAEQFATRYAEVPQGKQIITYCS